MKGAAVFLCFLSLPLALGAAPSESSVNRMEGEAAVARAKGAGNDILVITAQERATDIKHVFEFLEKKQQSQMLSITLSNGSVIKNILTIDVMPGGTLMLIKANTMKGQGYQVVPTEEVKEVTIDS